MNAENLTPPSAVPEPSMPSSVLLLVNPAAGSTDDEAMRAARSVWDDLEIPVELVTLGDDDGEWVRRVAEPAGQRLVVAGGDGTVHAVVQAIAQHRLAGLAVAILPLGTGNDFARSAGIPQDPREAALAAVRGRVRAIDLLRDDRGGVVMNAAHIGVGALASERAEAAKGMLGPLGYAVGAALAGAGATSYSMRVEADGSQVASPDEQLLMVGIGVGRTIGGGTPLAPDASLDDGRVDVVVVSATGALAKADFARRVRHGTHPERDDVLVIRARHVAVDAGDAPLNVDGELLGEAGSRRWTVESPGWSVVVPDGG
jgi:YegS/Rv2252/BmrU family lipid kinase